jgi:glycosyltransferase involved in cell wall biosynthesis
MRPPLVSVLLPVLNCEATVGRAIHSILFQTLDDFELLVLDDGSTDGTVGRAAATGDPRVRVLTGDTRLGLAGRLNGGMLAARGRYIARMDGDDVSLPDRLEKQVRVMESDPGLDLCGAGMILIDARLTALGVVRPPSTHEEILARVWRPLPVYHPTWLARADWITHHRYDATLGRAQDQDLLHRAARSSRYYNVEEPLLGYSVGDHAKVETSRRAFAGVLWQAGLQERSVVRLFGALAYYGMSIGAVRPKREAGACLSRSEGERWEETVRLLAGSGVVREVFPPMQDGA